MADRHAGTAAGARALLDAVLVDVGGTLVEPAPPELAVGELQARLLPGVLDDLVALKAQGLRLGAVTNTSVMGEAQVRALLAPVGLDELLDVVVTSVDAGAPKPDPAPVRLALKRLGVDDPRRVLFVGDLPTDGAAAEGARAPFAPVIFADGRGVGSAVASWVKSMAGRRFDDAINRLSLPDRVAAAAARVRHERLTKPRCSLGRLEEAGIALAAIAGESPPPVPRPATVVIFAADHGVVAEGVSPWPQEVTAQMVSNFCAGGGAINVLARHVGADVVVVDVGVATPVPTHAPNLLARKIGLATANLAREPAMTPIQTRLALDVGVELAERCVSAGTRCLITGDMGIGNTTASAALIASFAGLSPETVTGRGTGIDDLTLARKVSVVEQALAQAPGAREDPLGALAWLGGFEISALVGLVVGGAALRVPVLIDGVIAAAALLVAQALDPRVRGYAFAGHRSSEPGSGAALEHLGMKPLVDLDMRLGEGTGAALALPILQAAAKVLAEMATFDRAGVSDLGDVGRRAEGHHGATVTRSSDR